MWDGWGTDGARVIHSDFEKGSVASLGCADEIALCACASACRYKVWLGFHFLGSGDVGVLEGTYCTVGVGMGPRRDLARESAMALATVEKSCGDYSTSRRLYKGNPWRGQEPIFVAMLLMKKPYKLGGA